MELGGQGSQRTLGEDSSSFWSYTSPGATLYRPTTTIYDPLDRPTTLTAPDGGTTEHRYGVTGDLTYDDVTDANDHRIQSRSDALGRLVAVVEYRGNGAGEGAYAVDAITSYSYDARDQLVQVSDAAGNLTTLSYDSLGRKIEMRDPDMGRSTYEYDPFDNLLNQTDAKQQTISFTYDALNRPRSTTMPGGRVSWQAYDEGSNGLGRRTSTSTNINGVGQTYASWSYDARGRLISATRSGGGISRSFAWTYDSADLIRTMTYPNGDVLSLGYDSAWRPRSATLEATVELGSGALARQTFALVSGATYDALDQPLLRTLGNALIEQRSYSDPQAHLSRVQVGSAATPGSVLDRSYAYDLAGNISAITDRALSPAQTQNFRYDQRDRLTQAWTSGNSQAAYNQTYSYSPIGNLLTKNGVSYSYPAGGPTTVRPHAPTAIGGVAQSYDANGNLTSDGARSYSWTPDNRLASVTGGGVTESYSYDADGRRVLKRSGSVTTFYAEQIWEEVIGGVATATYTFGGQVIALRTGDGRPQYLHTDHLGGDHHDDRWQRGGCQRAGVRPVGPGARRRGQPDQPGLHRAAPRRERAALLQRPLLRPGPRPVHLSRLDRTGAGPAADLQPLRLRRQQPRSL